MTNFRSYLYRLQFFATRGLPLAPLALALSSVSGCSSGAPDDSQSESIDSAAQAIIGTTKAPTLASPECDPEGISSTANICDGPWSYIYKEDDTTIPRTCEVRSSCELWRNGTTVTTRVEDPEEYPNIHTATCPKPAKCTSPKCKPPPPKPCKIHATIPANYCDGTVRTNELRAAAIAQVEAEWKKHGGTAAAKAARIKEINTKVVAKGVITKTDPKSKAVERYASCRFDVTDIDPVKKVNDACQCSRWEGGIVVPGKEIAMHTAAGKVKPTDNVVSASCTTCDHESTTAKKYTCLDKQLTATAPPTVKAADFTNAIAARLKLLYELKGTELTADQIKTIKATYSTKTAGPVCHEPIGVSATCAPLGKATDAKKVDEALNTRLLVCESLGRAHVSGAVALQEVAYCAKTYELVAKLAAGDCKDEYIDEVTTHLRSYMGKLVEGITYNSSKKTFGNLSEVLTAIDTWYDGVSKLPGADADAEIDAVLVKFWEHVYDVSGARPKDVTNANWTSVVGALWQSGLAVDVAVLNAVFASGQTLNSAPLLRVTAGALRSIVDRLEEASALHDVARRYRPSNRSTQTSELWAILAALPSQSALATALANATNLRAKNKPLAEALDLINASHSRLVAAAGGATAFEKALNAAEPSADIAELVRIIRLAQLRVNNVSASGTFSSAKGRVLHVGMQDKSHVVTGSRDAITTLNAEIAKYNTADKSSLVNALLAEARGDAGTQALEDRLAILWRRIMDAEKEVGGLQAREQAEALRFADYATAFQELRDQGVFDEDLVAASDVLTPLKLSASHARFDKVTSATVADMAVLGFKQPLAPGEMLQFNVSDSWAPSCALQKASEEDVEFDIQKTDALVGPEGYMVRWDSSSFSAESATEQSVRDKHASVDACLTVSGGFGTPFGGAQATVSGCVGMRWSESETDSSSSGSEQRQSASFNGGIHLKNTPFPNAPAGALLLVATAPNRPNVIRDVMVVGSRGFYMAPGDAAVLMPGAPAVDVYLVVNDLSPAGGKCVARPEEITVQAQKITPAGSIAKAVSEAMAATLEEFENEAPQILQQGQLLPSEETQLRAEARQRVVSKAGRDFSLLPPAMQDLYETYVSAKIASLARRATLAREKRELEVAVLEAASLEREYHSSKEQTEALQALAMSALRQFKDHKLDEYQQNVVSFVRDYVPPILELRYPRALATLLAAPTGATAAASAVNELNALENFDFAAPTGEVATKLLALATKVQSALEKASITSSEVSYPKAVLVFPKPENFGVNGEPPMMDPATDYRTVDIVRARQFWDALRSTPMGKASFTIDPSDLYDFHGGNSRLGCHESAPVIREMGIYASTNDLRDWGDADSRLPLQIGAEQFFPTPGGIQHYTKANTDWLNARIPVIGGDSSVAFQTLKQRFADNNTGMGLSPFGTFTVDLTRFPAALEVVEDIRVLFSLEVRPSAPVVAVDSCLFDN